MGAVSQRSGRVSKRAAVRARVVAMSLLVSSGVSVWTASACVASASAAATPAAGPAAVTWGSNYHGHTLGAGYKDTFEDTPVAVQGLTEITAVAGGYFKNFALLANGTVRGWGNRGLGDGNNESSGAPQAVLAEPKRGEVRELTGVQAIAVAASHSMVLLGNGTVMTWGDGSVGERGNGEYGTVEESDQRAREKGEPDPTGRSVAAPVTLQGKPLTHIKAIATSGGGFDGDATDYALAENGTTLWAWGQDSSGNLGIGKAKGLPSCNKAYSPRSVPCSPEPVEVKLKLEKHVTVAGISAGGEAAYAVLSNGKVLAWGNNYSGQLGSDKVPTEGRPSEEISNVPVAVEGLGGKVTSVAGGADFALARLSDGEVDGWGANSVGELGAPSTEKCKKTGHYCDRTAKLVAGLQNITQVSAGAGSSLFALALNSAGTIYSWGWDKPWGQLGYGTLEGLQECGGEASSCNREPRAIEGISPEKLPAALSVDAGEQGAIAILKNGSAPKPPIRVKGEEKRGKLVLNLEWTGGSPTSSYFIRIMEEPPATNENVQKAREDWEAAAAYEDETADPLGGELEEARLPSEEAGLEGAEQEEPEVAADRAELEQAAKNYETKAEREYMGPAREVSPLAEGRGPCTVAEPCKHTIEEGITRGEHLGAHEYTVQLRPESTVNGIWRINGTP